MNVLLQAPVFASQHANSALVTVVSTSGSTPRHSGAHMLVSIDGTTVGTIGGGMIEHQLAFAGAEVATRGTGNARLVKHNLVQDLAMCCGGSMEVYVEPLSPIIGVIEEVVQRRASRQNTVLITNLCLGTKQVRNHDSQETIPDFDGETFYELMRPPPRMVLFGCGHLSRALGPLARGLGFDVVICDDNETSAVEQSPPWSSAVVESFALRDVERRVGKLGVGDYLIVLTRDHSIDQKIVEAALPRIDEFEYLGLIGSLGKVGRFRKRILAKGKVDETQWNKLRAPIGIDIAAETPEEIAVSIMAELVLLKNRGQG